MSKVGVSKKPIQKINPQKFAMWLAITTIIMMFAGFTSGYVVRRAQGQWDVLTLPPIFIFSTIAIVFSSVTMHFAIKSYKKEAFSKFRMLLTSALLLGIAFSVMQLFGFYEMHEQNVKIAGNPSGSFLYIIAGIHLLHITGGIIAIVYQLIKTRHNKITKDNVLGLEIVGTYWHFVDILWIYLYLFFTFFR